jgi:hypothetical protein
VFDLLGEGLPSSTRDRIRVLALDNTYTPLSDGALTSLLDVATDICPGILPPQIVAVTSSVVRTVEACIRAGFQQRCFAEPAHWSVG